MNNKLYQNKETGLRVLVIFESDELVTYLSSHNRTPVPVRKFVFLQDFEEVVQCEI